ncbi:ATP-binding protein [Anaeromyxobacter oryzisoli]|uniref:ATP-binding protein n=1 Tax=Anaeromyxobacter oryzisoli TaxID=2925408 RepID=UPI001F5617E1|nr:ATP-binding protein [Anaeromyxobacter sp. SG63]
MSLPPSFLNQRLPLADLLDLRSFAEVCHSFSELYRVGLKVFDEEGNRLVDVKVGNADFCGYLWSKPAGRARCMETVGRVKSERLAEEARPVTFACFSGCRYVVQPILYEGDCLGRVVFGPFVPEEERELPEALLGHADLDPRRAASYQSKIRRVPMGTAGKILKHFMDLVDVLVFTGHKNLIAAKLHIEAVRESYRELSEKNQKLAESYSALKELDRLKSSFLATMSHELRTPLTSVIGYSEMMLEGLGGPLTAEQREYLGIIMEKGENLLQLITSILDISKIEAGRVRLVLSEVDVCQLMRDAVATLLPLARKRGLKVSCEPVQLPRIHADRDKLRQCLVNLCSNAVKFTPAGGSVVVRGEALGGERLAIHVTDSGIGISEEHLAKVFEVFFQVDGSTTREYGGAGLGLAIVKSYVEAHGGEVQVRSAPGAGSTFTVVLPIRSAAAGPLVTPVPSAAAAGGVR